MSVGSEKSVRWSHQVTRSVWGEIDGTWTVKEEEFCQYRRLLRSNKVQVCEALSIESSISAGIVTAAAALYFLKSLRVLSWNIRI